MIYSGVDRNKIVNAGTAIFVSKRWKNKIESCTFIDERTVTVRFRINQRHLLVVGIIRGRER